MKFLTLFEKVSLRGSYVGGAFQRLVAARYKLAPATEPEALKLYEILAKKIAEQKKQLMSRFSFSATMDDPYTSMKHLSKEIDSQRRSGIRKPEVKALASPPEGGHPALTNDQNTDLRWVHDIIAHYMGQHPFSARGEYGAYNRHLKTLPKAVAPILFTEIIGQTSFYKIYGDYTVQKTVILRDFDPFNVGCLSGTSPLNKWFKIENKALVPYNFNWSKFSQEEPALAKELLNQPKFDPKDWEGYDQSKDMSVTRNSKL